MSGTFIRLRKVMGRTVMAAGLVLGLLLGCESGELVSETVIDLPFDGSLENRGTALMSGEAVASELAFGPGRNGQALFTEGAGGWVRLAPDPRIVGAERFDIAFDFKREDWQNPYRKGSASQTVVAVRGRDGKKIQHLAFNLSPGPRGFLSVRVTGTGGEKATLASDRGSLGLGWHAVRLVADAGTAETVLYLDGEAVARENIFPDFLANGIDRLKFGTWHKKNQAFRGHVDNFTITAAHRQ